MTKPSLTKIEQPPATLRDIVQDRMREAIIEGHFKPGERLVERPLCDQLGVSRTVIRETIRYLEAEGLVEILPGKGPIVARMSWEDAQQIYDIRRMLETAAAVTCARNMTPDLAARLTAALEALNHSYNNVQPGGLFKATACFYSIIFEEEPISVDQAIYNKVQESFDFLKEFSKNKIIPIKKGPEFNLLSEKSIELLTSNILEVLINGTPYHACALLVSAFRKCKEIFYYIIFLAIIIDMIFQNSPEVCKIGSISVTFAPPNVITLCPAGRRSKRTIAMPRPP